MDLKKYHLHYFVVRLLGCLYRCNVPNHAMPCSWAPTLETLALCKTTCACMNQALPTSGAQVTKGTYTCGDGRSGFNSSIHCSLGIPSRVIKTACTSRPCTPEGESAHLRMFPAVSSRSPDQNHNYKTH